MYQLIRIFLLSILPITTVMGQMNIQLLEAANAEGFIVYTGSNGLQEYHKLDSLFQALGVGNSNPDSLGGQAASYYLDYNNLVNAPTLFSGDYNDLTNKPTLFDGNYNSLSNLPNLFSGSWNDLSDKPTLFDGNYNSLTNKPTLFDGTWNSLTGKPTTFAPSSHNHTESEITDLDHYTDADIGGDETAFDGWDKNSSDDFSGNYNDLTNKPSLFSGSYSDLTDKPTLFDGNYNSLTNKPTLFSGSYDDLTDKPTSFPSAWTDISGKPTTFTPSSHSHTESDITDLDHYTDADIQGNEAAFNGWDKDSSDDFDGAYSSLTGKPSIFPTNWINVAGIPADILDGDNNTTYTADNTTLQLVGTQFRLKDNSSQGSVNNSGQVFIQDINLDAYGRITGLTSATATGQNDQIIGLSDLVVGGQTIGVLWELSDNGGQVIFKEGANITLSRTLNELTIASTSASYTADNTSIELIGSQFRLKDNSSQSSINNSGNTFIQDITLDTYGRVTGLTSAAATDNNTTYTADNTTLQLVGTQFRLKDNSSQGSVNNSGRTVIQDITLDAYGRITGLGSVTLSDANTTYTADESTIQLVSGQFRLKDNSTQGSVNNSGNVFIQDITVDAYGRITGLASATATSSGSDGNGIYSGNGTADGRTVLVGSNSLYFQGVSATNAEIRGYTLSEAFFNNQTSISTPNGTTTGWDGIGYRSSTSYLMNNNTTIVRGESALYLAPPNQSTASTGWVMTKQSDGTASWQAASGGSDGNGIYSANGTVNGRTISVGSSDLLFDMSGSTSNINIDGGRMWGWNVGEMVFSNQNGISTPNGTTTGWDYVGYRGSTSALMNNGTTIVQGESSLYINPPNQSTAETGEVLTKQSNGTTQWDLGGKFSKATYITGAGSSTNTYTATSPVYIQTAADNLILADNRAGRVFVIQVHSGSAQINTTSGTVIVDGVGYTNGSYFQPAGTTSTYVRNDANTHWIALKH